eukprot:gene23926-32324_t
MLVLLFFLATLCTIPSLYKSIEQQLSDADALCYLSNYPDLKEKYGDDIEKAKSHWKSFGRIEHRVSDCVPRREYDRKFVKTSNSSPIYFVSNGLLYVTNNCKPCGPSRSVCDNGIPVHLIESSDLLNSKIQSNPFECASQLPESWEGYNHAVHRIPLKLNISKGEPVRFNILMTGVGRDFTGGPLSIMHFANELMLSGLRFRWINVDGAGLKANEFKDHAKKYNYLSKFSNDIEFVYDAGNIKTERIQCNENDMFIATLYYTAQTSHFTIHAHPKLKQRNSIYFIQDFEPSFFPQDSNYMEALESYSFPHFAIYSTPFLRNWFEFSKMGPYQYLHSKEILKGVQFATKPAIKRYPALEASMLNDPTRPHKLISYLRRHADRNAYSLTLDALSAAVCADVFDRSWEFIGVGALSDYNVSIGYQCGRVRKVIIKQNIPEPEYQKLVATGDVGYSLMISPHPSLPPFDFAAAGLITVTNSFRTKTVEHFRNVSQNFVIVKPFIESIVSGLKKAVILSRNISYRQEGKDSFRWERSWTGPECFGKPLLNMVRNWQKLHEPLWTVNYELS